MNIPLHLKAYLSKNEKSLFLTKKLIIDSELMKQYTSMNQYTSIKSSCTRVQKISALKNSKERTVVSFFSKSAEGNYILLFFGELPGRLVSIKLARNLFSFSAYIRK